MRLFSTHHSNRRAEATLFCPEPILKLEWIKIFQVFVFQTEFNYKNDCKAQDFFQNIINQQSKRGVNYQQQKTFIDHQFSQAFVYYQQLEIFIDHQPSQAFVYFQMQPLRYHYHQGFINHQ